VAEAGRGRGSAGAGPGAGVVFRAPRVGDGAAAWRLARASERLDPNSAYFYLLFCTRFAATSQVAEERKSGGLLGFVAGLRWPDDPRTVFVWQVGVDAAARGRGVASGLLDALLRSEGCRDVVRIESTVTPSNEASLALFRSLARRWEAPCEESVFLRAEDFPAEAAHEAELLLRIGPLRRAG
jgi:L-2,4-diaminobutyric acid acetyltransferase